MLATEEEHECAQHGGGDERGVTGGEGGAVKGEGVAAEAAMCRTGSGSGGSRIDQIWGHRARRWRISLCRRQRWGRSAAAVHGASKESHWRVTKGARDGGGLVDSFP
jgi:hypothetical protein